MPLAKNKGPLLTSLIKGVVDLIPPEWRALVGITQTDQEVPLDIGPDELTGNLVESRVIQTRTDERKKTNISLTDPENKVLVDEQRLPNGQIAVRTRSFLPDGTPLVTPNGAVSGVQNTLGIGWMEQSVVDASLPGPTILSTRLDPDGEIVKIAKTRKLISDIACGESIISGIWTRISKEGETVLVATEVVESRPILT